MAQFAIIEVDSGLTVVEFGPNASPDEEAMRHGGLLVDPGPFPTYDEACDAMLSLQEEEEED
jgi:hypothetical protein